MKQFVAILLIFVILLQSTNKLGIVVDFKINQDFISEVLCVNKDKPESKCNGMCYLSKRLNEQEEKETILHLENKIEVLFISAIPSIIKHYTDFDLDTYKLIYCINPYSSNYLDRIFHPPK